MAWYQIICFSDISLVSIKKRLLKFELFNIEGGC